MRVAEFFKRLENRGSRKNLFFYVKIKGKTCTYDEVKRFVFGTKIIL